MKNPETIALERAGYRILSRYNDKRAHSHRRIKLTYYKRWIPDPESAKDVADLLKGREPGKLCMLGAENDSEIKALVQKFVPRAYAIHCENGDCLYGGITWWESR